MDSIIAEILPNYSDLLSEMMVVAGTAFTGGSLAAFLIWPIGYAVSMLMGIVEGMSR